MKRAHSGERKLEGSERGLGDRRGDLKSWKQTKWENSRVQERGREGKGWDKMWEGK